MRFYKQVFTIVVLSQSVLPFGSAWAANDDSLVPCSLILKEFVLFRNSDSLKKRNLISGVETIRNYEHAFASNGSQISIEVMPGGPAKAPLQLNASEQSLSTSNAVQVASKPALSGYDLLSASEKLELAEGYMEAKKYSQTTRDMIREILLNDGVTLPYYYEYLKTKQIGTGSQNSSSKNEVLAPIKLSTQGDDRYFRFTPEGSSKSVAARVMDIHSKEGDASQLYVMVEYLESESISGARVRHVAELTAEEIQTAHRGDLTEIMESFLEVLTPVEIETKMLANKLGMKLFSYAPIERIDGAAEARHSLFSSLNNGMSEWLRLPFEAQFGEDTERFYQEYDLQKDEKVNFIDVFARLNPRYVIDRFKHHDLDFMWVITEDGQLIVSPKAKKGSQVRAQIVRLAGGRKIYAGGNFSFNPNGKLDIRFESNEYEAVEFDGTDARSFFDKNPHLVAFTWAVFGAQADYKLASYQFVDSRMFARTGEAGEGKAYTGSSESNDYLKDFMSRDGKREALSWNQETELPLDLKEWGKKVGINESQLSERGAKMSWAHYVLGTNDNTPLQKIKQSMKTLAKKFHTDLANQPGYKEAMTNVNLAWEEFEVRKNRR